MRAPPRPRQNAHVEDKLLAQQKYAVRSSKTMSSVANDFVSRNSSLQSIFGQFSSFLYYVHNDRFSQGKENSVAIDHTHLYIAIKAVSQKASPN